MVFQHFPGTDTGDLRRKKIPADLVHLPGKPDSELIGARKEWEDDVSEEEGLGRERLGGRLMRRESGGNKTHCLSLKTGGDTARLSRAQEVQCVY
jgi:hypothetical protein